MLPRRVLSSAITLSVLALALPGLAQSGPSAQPPVEVLPSNGEAPAKAPGGEKGEGEKKQPITPAAGYAYGDTRAPAPAATAGARRPHYRKHGPVVNMPGFEQTAEGGSRLFIQLSQNVPVEERRAEGSITYVLKGASVRVWNNTNALVTVHFNTPVSRARLVPHGQDLHFVVEVRAAAAPTWKISDAPDKTALLSIDFPKGEYLQGPAPGEAANAPPPAARAQKANRRRGGGGTRPPPSKPQETPETIDPKP